MPLESFLLLSLHLRLLSLMVLRKCYPVVLSIMKNFNNLFASPRTHSSVPVLLAEIQRFQPAHIVYPESQPAELPDPALKTGIIYISQHPVSFIGSLSCET